jgi:hypothetical protein
MTTKNFTGVLDLKTGEMSVNTDSTGASMAAEMILSAPGTEVDKALAQILYNLYRLHGTNQMSDSAFELLKVLTESALVVCKCEPEVIQNLTKVIDDAQDVAQNHEGKLQ